VTSFVALTPSVAAVKVTVDEPAAILRVVGVTTLKLLDARMITAPPVGAGAARVIVPPGLPPPTTDVGEIVMLARSAGFTVNVAVATMPLMVAEIVAV
jgi:hypothetical protein